jgi:hypothetical protein
MDLVLSDREGRQQYHANQKQTGRDAVKPVWKGSHRNRATIEIITRIRAPGTNYR